MKLGPQTVKKTGFPEYMFVITDEYGETATHNDGVDSLFDALQLILGNYIFTEEVDNVIIAKRKFTSIFSLETFDDRLSIDCVAHSRSVLTAKNSATSSWHGLRSGITRRTPVR